MPAFKSIVLASVGIFAMASAKKELKPFVQQLSDVVTFDVNALNRTQVNDQIVHVTNLPAAQSSDSKSIEKRDTVDCIIPATPAVPEDCRELCNQIDDWLLIPSLEIRGWTYGTCGYGIANLDPCRIFDMPYESSKAWCNAMLQQCVVNGWDGFGQEAEYKLAYSLYGIDNPPAYPEPSPCEGGGK